MKKYKLYKVCVIGSMLIWDYVFSSQDRAITYAKQKAHDGLTCPGTRHWNKIHVYSYPEGERPQGTDLTLVWEWNDSMYDPLENV